MHWFRRIAQAPIVLTHGIVRDLTTGFDALIGPVGRMNDGVENHLLARTRLLRAHYAVPANRRAAPLPILDTFIDPAVRRSVET